VIRQLLKLTFFKLEPQKQSPEYILDNDIASVETLLQVQKNRSRISEKWKIITRIQMSDFVHALRDAREAG